MLLGGSIGTNAKKNRNFSLFVGGCQATQQCRNI